MLLVPVMGSTVPYPNQSLLLGPLFPDSLLFFFLSFFYFFVMYFLKYFYMLVYQDLLLNLNFLTICYFIANHVNPTNYHLTSALLNDI